MASNLTIWHIEVPERQHASDYPIPAYTGHISGPTTDQAQMLAWTRRVYAVPDHLPVVVKEATDYADHR